MFIVATLTIAAGALSLGEARTTKAARERARIGIAPQPRHEYPRHLSSL